MHSDSPQSATMLVLALIAVFCRVRELTAFCELGAIRSTNDAPRQLTQSCQCGTNESRTPWNKTFPLQVFSLAARSRFGSMRERNMHQNCIQKARSRFGNACSEIERKDFRPLRLPPWPWLLLCLLGLLTLRNIRGAYREKVTSTASIKHRSNVSGPRVSAAAP
jgi:hypothetical protein